MFVKIIAKQQKQNTRFQKKKKQTNSKQSG